MLSTSIRVRQRVFRWPRSSIPSYAHAERIFTCVQLRALTFARAALAGDPCARQTKTLLGSGRLFKTPTNICYLNPDFVSSSSIFAGNSPRFQHTATMSTAASPPVEVEHDQYRLPANVKATHYDVTIKTDLESLTFQGLVNIKYVLLFIIIPKGFRQHNSVHFIRKSRCCCWNLCHHSQHIQFGTGQCVRRSHQV